MIDTGNKSMVLWRPKLFYFLFFAAAACLMPFLSLYYEAQGLTGRQIGLLVGVVPLVTLVSAPLWGALADVTRSQRLSLMLAIAGAWTAVLIMSHFTSFGGLLPAVILYAFFLAPIVPLMDNSVLALLGSQKEAYGKLRLWGAVGWGLAAALLGPVLQRGGLQWTFYGFLIFIAGAFLVAWQTPVVVSPIQQKYGAGLRRLLAHPAFLLLLGVAFVHGISLTIMMNFLFLHLEKLGASRTLMALSLTVATASEIPFWFISGWLLRRWGVRRMMALSLAVTAVRAFAYTFMSAPWLVLPISLLHGPSFALMWSAGVAYADRVAPSGLRATAQAVFAAMTMGLGAAVGALLGGVLYDEVGPVVLFQIVGALLLLSLLLFGGLERVFSSSRRRARARL
jgi:MFS transporter, PPP family, 3-phenylpropionic acid transporter